MSDSTNKLPPADIPDDILTEDNLSIGELLKERGKTHGNFVDHATATQRFKGIFTSELAARQKRSQPPLSFEQREAIEMILHKLGRILAGNANFAAHWDDIAGYASLCGSKK